MKTATEVLLPPPLPQRCFGCSLLLRLRRGRGGPNRAGAALGRRLTTTLALILWSIGSPLPAQPPLAAPAYWIATMEVRDPAAFAREFMPLVTTVFVAHGGRYLARGGKIVPLEGRPPKRVVILQFPSVADAQAAHASAAYKQAREVGDRYATFESIIIVEGLPQP